MVVHAAPAETAWPYRHLLPYLPASQVDLAVAGTLKLKWGPEDWSLVLTAEQQSKFAEAKTKGYLSVRNKAPRLCDAWLLYCDGSYRPYVVLETSGKYHKLTVEFGTAKHLLSVAQVDQLLDRLVEGLTGQNLAASVLASKNGGVFRLPAAVAPQIAERLVALFTEWFPNHRAWRYPPLMSDFRERERRHELVWHVRSLPVTFKTLYPEKVAP